MKLYTYPGNAKAFATLIAAEYNGVDIEIPDFKMGVDNVTPEFLAKSPMGKVPCLETASGSLFQSKAIARYVAQIRRDTELMGASFFQSGQVDSWMDWCTHELELPATMWYYPVLGYMPHNAMATEKARADLAKALAVLEAYLLDKTYLVGEKITLADITIASALVYPFKLVCGPSFRGAFPCVMRWFNTCVNQPQFKAVIGTVALAETELVADGAAAAPAAKAGKSNKASKKEKKKANAEQQPKKKKEKKSGGGGGGGEKKEKPKEEPYITMLKGLPRPGMPMDEWKRQYSNLEYADSFAWLMEQDSFKSEYSVWRSDYNYNAENTKLFMTSNLCGGFLQRTGEIRKWTFGCMAVTGKDENADGGPDMKVHGIWIILGQDLSAPMLGCNPDSEYHTWTKLDLNEQATKDLMFDTWTKEVGEEIRGVGTVLDSKVFK